MTREELHTEVAWLTSEIVGMVSDLSPFDWKRKAEIDKEILDLFDRFEEQQWKPGDWPPGDTHSKLVTGGEGESRWFSLAWCALGGDGWIHTSGVPMPQRVRFWRELPAPPKEGR